MTIGVLHLGIGNIGSLCQCLDRIAVDHTIITEPVFDHVEKLLFPGVGHFARAAEILGQGFRESIQNWISQDKPFLGICVGYQLLFQGSDEDVRARGLGFFKDRCHLVPSQKRPHMGWNQVNCRGGHFHEFDQSWMYFVHSFAPPVSEESMMICEDGGVPFSVGSWRGRVGGVQFHPEKSHQAGQDFLRYFIEKV